ncbi:MAG: hypothetical protein AUH29_15450 [Candidatus Rokubacteria bacterium 13_1_40CM_69_27]|nr:MAG: hypothetical protein AUH29_15450 [Candidatus Rokubacteria bacterium 13_1_40CM_69_27]OLC30473.1 MAG: hypothetical protein AUH81_20050 [Candidatus Rokubacteria bacterium 13_1_40CM_4_69_5]
MQLWAQAVIVVCVLAVTVALVPLLVALRRAAERADRVLAIAEQELQPLVSQLQALVDDLRLMSGEVRGEVGRLGALAEQAQGLSDGLSRVMSAIAGLSRAGQLVGVAASIKTGLDVFLHRLRKQQGENHE